MSQNEFKAKAEELNVKKTMVSVTALLLAAGADKKLKNWDEILVELQPKEGSTGSTGPREITILKDAEKNVLGRKCSVTGKFYVADRFYKGGAIIKEADAVKGKLYSESKVMEDEAKKILVEARDITDPMDKVAKYEAYDAKLEEAKAHRAQEIAVDEAWLEGSFETIEDLAKHLNVEVNPEPAKEEAPEAESAE